MFTDKRLDQVLGIEESSSKCLTARNRRYAPRLFHQDVGNAFPCYLPRHLHVWLHVGRFTSEKWWSLVKEFGSYSAIEASGWINATPGIYCQFCCFELFGRGRKTVWCFSAQERDDLGAAMLSWCLTGSSITFRAGGTCRNNRLKRLLGHLHREEHHQLFRINSLQWFLRDRNLTLYFSELACPN